jgi:hypothetical protein
MAFVCQETHAEQKTRAREVGNLGARTRRNHTTYIHSGCLSIVILQDFLDAGGKPGNFRVIKTETNQPVSVQS